MSAVIEKLADRSRRCSFIVANDPFKIIDFVVCPEQFCLSGIQSYAETYGKTLDSYLSAHPPRRKKLEERVWLEQARRYCAAFPDFDVVDSEEPDFLLSKGSDVIGVEVTGLWQPATVSAFTPKTVAATYNNIVRKSKKQIDLSGGTTRRTRYVLAGCRVGAKCECAD